MNDICEPNNNQGWVWKVCCLYGKVIPRKKFDYIYVRIESLFEIIISDELMMLLKF